MYKLLLFLLLGVAPSVFSQNINVSDEIVFDGEPYLAIDPNNDQHLIAAWMGFKLGQNIIIKISHSNDGGSTWSAPIETPHEVAGNSSADPSLQYDSNGDVFLCYIDFNNVDFTNGAIYVKKSTDNGLTWGNTVEVTATTDCPNKLCIDRPWIAIDRSGGATDGTIYVTSMNANQPTIVSPPYNPYVSISTDGGNSFTHPRFLDTTNYLSGNIIPQPMPSPTVDANGTFYATYPSYETSQSPFVHLYLASSSNQGVSVEHTNAYTITIPASQDPFSKKASLLISDPSAPNHLAVIFIADPNTDGGDIYFMETFDATNWTSPVQVNQDPTGSLQDLTWANFNENGDLAVCWRDRRNGATSGYQTETEIYGSIRFKDSTNFEPDFALSSQQVNHNSVLEESGNDFMNVQFLGDTLYTIWGDVRTGTVNVFLTKRNIIDGTSSLHEVYQEKPQLLVYPNPSSSYFTILNITKYESLYLTNSKGQFIQNIIEKETSISHLPKGTYFIHFQINHKRFSQSININ